MSFQVSTGFSPCPISTCIVDRDYWTCSKITFNILRKNTPTICGATILTVTRLENHYDNPLFPTWLAGPQACLNQLVLIRIILQGFSKATKQATKHPSRGGRGGRL